MKSLFDLKDHFQAFREIVLLLTKHRQLTWEMTKREISDRYAGQVFGALWAIGHPLILMGVYIFIFAVVFKMRIGGSRELPLNYTTYLLSGLIPWMAFQESMSKGVTVIVGNANLVKQVVFPIEILPVKGVIASFVTQVIYLAILIIYVFVVYRLLPLIYLFIPVLFLLQVLAMIGVSYILSSVGTYFRDLKDFVQVFCTAGVYIMPIFYLPSMVPALFRPVLYMNPFSYLVWCYQDVFYFGKFEHPWAWVIFTVLSIGVFYGGYRIFRRLKIMFGNVL
ncbi:MAG: ABC transporter permease [Candidatus Omnitrophica bacterium]|nr:ABC transporter permease [Candidatus Omnitrophota bacterium]